MIGTPICACALLWKSPMPGGAKAHVVRRYALRQGVGRSAWPELAILHRGIYGGHHNEETFTACCARGTHVGTRVRGLLPVSAHYTCTYARAPHPRTTCHASHRVTHAGSLCWLVRGGELITASASCSGEASWRAGHPACTPFSSGASGGHHRRRSGSISAATVPGHRAVPPAGSHPL